MKSMFCRSLLTLLATSACTPTAPQAPPPADVALPADVVPPAPSPTVDWAGVHGHMADHLIQLEKARQGLIRGDLAAATAGFGWLGGHTPVAGLPAGWITHVDVMQGAAARGAVATDFVEAGQALGAVAEACGACHADNGVSIRAVAVPAPIAEVGTKGHMRRHAWAADRMWEGLIHPSDALWDQGVAMLNEPPIKKGVHQMAGAATTAEQRAAAYGSFIAECASCHTESGVTP